METDEAKPDSVRGSGTETKIIRRGKALSLTSCLMCREILLGLQCSTNQKHEAEKTPSCKSLIRRTLIKFSK